MKKLKKQSIGFNSVSSENGVINARGVKSKPKNIEIFGHTREVGEGEKSPDNPYELVSLDSGNVNLYSEDKIIINTVGRTTSTGKDVYGIELPHPKTGYYCVKSDPSTEYPLTYNLYDIETNVLVERGWNIAINNNNSDKGKIIKVDDGLGLLLYDCRDGIKRAFTNRTNLMILDSPIMPDEYITDEHSIILSNNNTSIQVPVSVQLSSVEGVSDYLYRDTDRVWKLKQMCKKYEFDGRENFKLYSTSKYKIFYVNDIFDYKRTNQKICTSNYYTGIENKLNASSLSSCNNFSICFRDLETYYDTLYIRDDRFSTVEEFVSFLAEQYKNGITVTVIYQLETPVEHTLSDYAQDLLNSFTIQNQNKIFVEGYPDIKVSGYIQK